MVFESIVVDLVNRYLGDFIENLDTSQLKIGIWGGDIVLKDLYVRSSALADLNLPVDIIYGNIGALTLKVPWKNIYNDPTIATLEGLYVVAVPKAESQYDEEKEQKMAWDAKQKELQRMEDAAKLKAEQGQAKAPQADSFAEKLAANVIKNLQVHVTDIHIRYEDRFTNPKSPFSIGITLHQLLFQTTDENWVPTVIKGAATRIYKMVKLDSLALYWNHNSPLYMEHEKEQIQVIMKKDIASAANSVDNQYLIAPISSSAQLCLHLKPEETQFSIPKILLDVVFEEIAIALSRKQYTDIMELLESMERMKMASQYCKYNRPKEPKKGHAAKWWKFAYSCTVGENVRRHKNMWSWKRIVEHRQMSRQYKAAYVKKLRSGKKIAADLKTTLENYEKTLNIFNIVLIRNQAELENKLKPAVQSTGWFGGWFSGGTAATTEDTSNIGDEFQKLMTAEEKAKLYDALGYEENSVDPTLPEKYEAVKMNMQLKRVSLVLTEQRDQSECSQVLALHLDNMAAAIRQRPSANALRFETQMSSLTVYGAEVVGGAAVMVSSQTQDQLALLNLAFETNPLDKKCDQRVNLQACSLKIVYDAPTVNQLAEFFKPPEWVHLKQLQASAMMKFEELKEQTATGLQHAIEQRKYSDINVNFQPSHIIIPQTGVYSSGVNMLVLDLGEFVVSSAQPDKLLASPSKSSTQMLDYNELSEKAYDIFQIELRSVQVLFVPSSEDFRTATQSRVSQMHVLQPMALNIQLHKCMIQDVNLASMKVRGELPELNVSLSDLRVQQILQLLHSIPLPESGPPPTDTLSVEDVPDVIGISLEEKEKSLAWRMSTQVDSSKDLSVKKSEVKKTGQVNPTKLHLKFVIKQISLNLMQSQANKETPILKLVIESLGTTVEMRTFDMVAEAYLGGIYLQHLQFKALRGGPIVNLINSPLVSENSHLLTVQYLKAERLGPEFTTTYKNTEQTIDVFFTELEVLLHEEAILNILEFVASLQQALAAVTPPGAEPADVTASQAAVSSSSSSKTQITTTTATAHGKGKLEVINMALKAKIDVISIGVCTAKEMVTDLKVKGIQVGLSLQKSKTTIEAGLHDITVFDPTPNALYPKILDFENDVLKANVCVYNFATQGAGYSDLQCVDTDITLNTGCMKVVFLNKFVSNVLAFLDNFQAAKDRISEASSAVAESAVQAAQTLQTNAARVRLRVQLDAPLVIIPQSSTSNNALVIDLGHISVENHFRICKGRTDHGRPAVLEDMSVKLTSLKLARALMLGSEMRAECILLEPVTLQINLTRNLAASWYHSQPDIDVSGKLQSFSVSLSQGDFKTIMSILNENLKEGEREAKQETQKQVESVQAQSTACSKDAEDEATQEATNEVQQEAIQSTEKEQERYVKVVFSFSIESIATVLYTGNSNLTIGVSERDKAYALARFQLQNIALSGNIQSDSAISAAVSLRNCLLDDLRPGRENGISSGRVVGMMEQLRSATQHTDTPNMIDVTFTQQSNQDKDVMVRLYGLHICVCIDYLMAVGDFFTKGMPEADNRQLAIDIHTTEKPTVNEPSPPMQGSLNVHFHMDKPEVVLVENAMDLDTNALILKMDVEMKMRMSAEIQTMMGNVQQLQVFSSLYRLRDSTKTIILNPLDISFHSSAPNGKGHHMEAIFGNEIVMTISPTTIRILTTTLSSLSATPQTEEQQDLITYDDLWAVKTVTDCNFWFLKSVAENIEDMAKELETNGTVESRGEQLILSPMKMIIKLESGLPSRTVPFLIVEIGFHGEVRDWTAKLNVSCELCMEVAYYNEAVAVWEPLMEPIEDNNTHRPWELSVEVTQNDLLPPPSDEDDLDIPLLPQPKMTITATSKDILQLTISKTGLEVLSNLAQTFTDAYKLVMPEDKPGEIQAPYLLKNQTGHSISVKLDPSFQMPASCHNGTISLLPDDSLALNETAERQKALKAMSIIRSTQEDHMKILHIAMPDFGANRELKLVKAEKRAFSLNQRAYPNNTWQLICETNSHYGSKIIIFRSVLQVHNHLPFSMELFYQLSDAAMGRCGEVLEDGTCNIHLDAVYAAPSQLYFKPNDNRYQQSSGGFLWQDLPSGSTSVVSCSPTKNFSQFLHFNVQVETENVLFESTGEKTTTLYTLHLYPCVVLHNILPLPITCLIEGCEEPVVIQGGGKQALLSAKVGHTAVEIRFTYQEHEWSSRNVLVEQPETISAWTFDTSSNTESNSMDLGMYYKAVNGYQELSLYCPYWMINKTAKTLAYKSGDDPVVFHRDDFNSIILFTFKSKSLIGKKKVSLKVSDSDWSDKFSLDTVGSAGIVSCKYKSYTYEVGIAISLSSTGLTKIITFTPYYMFINQSKFPILCKEVADEASWITVPHNECIAFWPVQSGKKLQMVAKFEDSAITSSEFYFTEAHNTLLKIKDKYGGLNVECQPMESSIHIVFQCYQPGLASVQLVNHTSKAVVDYKQKGCKEGVYQLGAGETVLYTWQCALETREIIWSCGEQQDQRNDLVKDGTGDFFYNSDTKLYWVSFLYGMQRVLLFTEDLAVAITATQAGELERLDQEINLDLHGVGLSLVNNHILKEIAYMGITSSGVIWEERKRKRYKAMKVKQSALLERAFEAYTNALMVGNNPPSLVQLENKMEVDFGSEPMRMLKPRKCEIRRSFENGVSIQYRTSTHQTQLHLKIHRMQLDNQLPGAVFSTVLAPLPPPKSVAADSVPKPFTELSVMIRKRDFSNVMQFKYCKLLIQEMAVKVDQGFLTALIDLFASGEVSDERQLTLFAEDCAMVNTSLVDDCAKSSANEQKHFYDMLHFSPLKIHLSFSLYGSSGADKKPQMMQANVLNVFLQSVGIVLTDIQDVVFKLGYFERNYNFYNQSQLNNEIISHYSQQAIKQMYVLVLGLDVLGNPFGVIRGLAEGIEDLFYEPYQGAVQGPEEFAEGLALGVRSLLGHAVGGAAGAVSRITSALGKGIATLTLDDEYQKKRREQLNKKPADLKEGMARGTKRLVMGVFDGVTGIVRKPVEGAKKEGVEGFFKGVGKGLVGAITRPASGVVDFASISFEGIRRVADVSGEINRLRPPRFLHPDGIVRPFFYREAEGYDTLKDVEKGKYIETDSYIAHVIITRDLKNVLLVTDKRVIFASKGEIFGQWNCDWQYSWEELKEVPSATNKGVQLLLKEKQKKSLFKSGAIGKLVPIEDSTTVQWIVQKMKEAMAKVK